MRTIMETLRQKLRAAGISRKGFFLWLAALAGLIGACCYFLSLSPADSGRIYPVYITEILASNASYPNADGRCCDFIELYNSADYPVDLTSFQLGDIEGSGRYAFPAGTVMDAHTYLVVYCDKTADDDAYAQFAISRSGGEVFYLIGSNGAIVDRVTILASDIDQSMVLLGSTDWVLSSAVTPGQENTTEAPEGQDIYNSGVSPVRITEFSSAGSGYIREYALPCDWVELHNTAETAADISGFTLSDNVGNDKYVIPAGTVIPAGGYLVVSCADGVSDAAMAPFGLNQLGGETVVLKDASGRIVEIIDTAAMDTGCSMALTDTGWALTDAPSPGFENTAEGHTACLLSMGAEPGTIRISEVMSADQAILPDGYGDFSDWVELYNTGESAVDLSGWFLSDDPAQPGKWQFPSLTIQPGEYLLIFCSGRDTVADGEVHTGFSLSAGGESLLLTSYLGNTVDAVTFGQCDAGQSFVMDGASQPAATAFPTPGCPNTNSGYELFCASASPAGPLAIWEVMTANNSYLPQSLGKCYDWVELRNVSEETIQLSHYSISDDADEPGMYILPDKTLAPGESIVIILSGDTALSTASYAHAGFSLNAKEDQLFLFENGALLDYVYLRDIPVDGSYGRGEDGCGFYYMTPTPGKANAEGCRLISGEPVSNYTPGIYSGDTGFEVTLEADGAIYYTTDGSEPGTDSALYSGAIQISETTVLRAVSVESGKLPSDIYTATFLIQETHSIPVVSLVTDPEYLWGVDGVYRNGDITVKEERLPANVAYCGEDGSFSLDCEMSLHGDTTVTAFNKKSFTVRFQDAYDGPLNYDVFEDGEVTAFSSLLIRTSHESTYSTQMHDALFGAVASDACDTLLSQKYKYVALYLNGEYWGLYAIREHHSAEHYASYMDVPADTVSMVRYCTDQQNSLYGFYNFLETNSLTTAENYEYAKSILDLSSFADWIIFEAYTGNIDINGNMRYYYSTADGLWRCGLVDVDLGMENTAAFSEVANTFHHGRIVRNLLANEEFQELIAARLAELLSGPMSDGAMIARIDEMASVIAEEAQWEQERWGTPVYAWEGFVDQMRSFCDGRAQEMIDSFCWQVGLSQEARETYFGDLE